MCARCVPRASTLCTVHSEPTFLLVLSYVLWQNKTNDTLLLAGCSCDAAGGQEPSCLASKRTDVGGLHHGRDSVRAWYR